MLPTVVDNAGELRRHDRRHPRRAGPGARHGGRPAGGDGRPGLHQARHGQGDLRHRLLRDPQHRQHGGALEPPAADDHRLPARRPAHLRARRQHLHRRRGRAVAARRPAPHRERRPMSRPWPKGAKPGHGVYMVPAFVGLGAPYWDAEARGASARPDARHRPGRDRGRHPRFGLLPDPRPDRGDARRLARRSTSCGSTAAWWSTIR